MHTENIEQPTPAARSMVRRDVLVRTLAALETAADDAISHGPGESDADYLFAIEEAKSELEAPNDRTE